MNIAVLSGKGGTGKTTVSTNLAISLGLGYVDCDVEEPNGFIFLEPKINTRENVEVEYPVIDKDNCILCGECIKTCQFNAIANAGKKILVFEKLCHDCGACKLVCKNDAITYEKRVTGVIEKGTVDEVECIRGILNVGEPMAVPVIRQLLGGLAKGDYIIDCPPGTSCNVVNSLRYANAAILVTEPSEFGLHDMKMAIELVKLYKIPYGIIINKDNGEENLVKTFCKEQDIELLGVIPYSMEAAALYSKGQMLCDSKAYKEIFHTISKRMVVSNRI